MSEASVELTLSASARCAAPSAPMRLLKRLQARAVQMCQRLLTLSHLGVGVGLRVLELFERGVDLEGLTEGLGTFVANAIAVEPAVQMAV